MNNRIHITNHFNLDFAYAHSLYEQKKYALAHKLYEFAGKSVNQTGENKNVNLLRCELALLACKLSSTNIELNSAKNKFELLCKQYINIKSIALSSPLAVELEKDINRCNNILLLLENPINYIDYLYRYTKKTFKLICANENIVDSAKSISYISHAITTAENAINAYKDTSSYSIISELNNILISLTALLADKHFDKGEDCNFSNESRMESFTCAIECYKKAITLINDRCKIDTHSAYSDKVMPLHLSILNSWYTLATTLDTTHDQDYIKTIHQYIAENKLETLANRSFCSDVKKKSLQQLDEYLNANMPDDTRLKILADYVHTVLTTPPEKQLKYSR